MNCCCGRRRVKLYIPFLWVTLFFWVFLAVNTIAPPSAAGQNTEQPASDGSGIFTLHFENDVLGVDDSDRHYTNGIQLAWLSGEEKVPFSLTDWARGTFMFQSSNRIRIDYALGQNLYTPEDIESTEVVEDDRPYAGWLHANFGLIGCDEKTLNVLNLSVGIVGPSAFGKELQKWFHRNIDSPDPNGWDNQLHDELALMAVYQRQWQQLLHVKKVPLLGPLGVELDVAPHLGASLGNVFTYANAGFTVRFGGNLDVDTGPVRIMPSPPGAGFRASKRFCWYLFAGVDGRLVARNIFLDGNTFGSSHSVTRIPAVGDAYWGLSLAGFGVRASATYVLRSPEFTEQRRPDHFGAISISVRF